MSRARSPIAAVLALIAPIACSGPAVDPTGPGTEPTATIPIDAGVPSPPVLSRVDAAAVAVTAPVDAAAIGSSGVQKPPPLVCSSEPMLYYVLSWPTLDGGGQVTRQTVHSDGRWCYDGVAGSLTGILTTRDLGALNKLLAATTWTLEGGEMCDALPVQQTEVADVAASESITWVSPCDRDPHPSVAALIEGVGRRTTSTCTETGDIEYRSAEAPIHGGAGAGYATAITVWETGKWRVDVDGVVSRAGCLNSDERTALTRAVRKAKFVAAKQSGVSCTAEPNTAITIEAGNKSFRYESPCAAGPSDSLVTLIDLVRDYTDGL